MNPMRRILACRSVFSVSATSRSRLASESGRSLWKVSRRNHKYFSQNLEWWIEDYALHRGDPNEITTLYESNFRKWMAALGTVFAIGAYPYWIYWLKTFYWPRVEIFRLIEKDESGNNVIVSEIHAITSHGFSIEFPEFISRQMSNIHPSVVFLDTGINKEKLIQRAEELEVSKHHCRMMDAVCADASAEQADFRRRFQQRWVNDNETSTEKPIREAIFHNENAPPLEVSERWRHKYDPTWRDYLIIWIGKNLKQIMSKDLTLKIKDFWDCVDGSDYVATAEACVIYRTKLILGDSPESILPYCHTNLRTLYVIDWWKKREVKQFLHSQGYIVVGLWSPYAGRGQY